VLFTRCTVYVACTFFPPKNLPPSRQARSWRETQCKEKKASLRAQTIVAKSKGFARKLEAPSKQPFDGESKNARKGFENDH
jgi:hypothetical protein